jgi:hypothetical protein
MKNLSPDKRKLNYLFELVELIESTKSIDKPNMSNNRSDYRSNNKPKNK